MGALQESRRKDEGDKGTVRNLEDRVKQLEKELAACKSQLRGNEHPETSGRKPKGLLPPGSFRTARNGSRSLEKSESRDSSRSVLDDAADNLDLDYYYYKQGVLARPEWATRGSQRSPAKPSGLKWPFGTSQVWPPGRGAKSRNFADLIEHYKKISLVGPVMESCKDLSWKPKMFHPLVHRFSDHVSIPRVTLEAVDRALKHSAGPVTLRIIKDSVEEGTWADLEFDTVWANASGLNHWGLRTLDELVAFSDQRGSRKARFVHHILEACNQKALEDLDTQPTRHMYYHYGNQAGVKKEANILILQVSPLLVEVDKRVYYGLLYEHDASQKYSREVTDIVIRSHTVFRYTETALTIFTACGIILQQNPCSCTLFGIVASENTMYSDFDSDSGKPVDRLKALFGSNDHLYESMWENIDKKNEVWSKRMRLGKDQLRPCKDQVLSRKSSFASESDTEESLKGIWFLVSFTKFSDPADGNTAICCEMKNIHKLVLQEERVLESRKSEHELLQSIIPSHIIDHLLEEKAEERAEERSGRALASSAGDTPRSTPSPQSQSQSPSVSYRRAVSFVRNTSFSSDNSDRYLDLSALRMQSDQRVSAMAEHHPRVTVFFADIVGFTQIAARSSPGEVMIMLNRLFTLFDNVTDFHAIYKVETIGDSYMCVAGLSMRQRGTPSRRNPPEHHARSMVDFAKDILESAAQVTTPNDDVVEVRIGIHSGDVMTGVVGHKMPRFCLFGDTVNVASRMESTGRPGMIHASQATRDLTSQESWVPTGGVEAKGKGLVETYLLSS